MQTKDHAPCGTQSQVVAASGTGRPIGQSAESIEVSTSQKNSFDYKIRTRKFPKEVLEKWDAINKRGVAGKNAETHRFLQEILACAGGGFDSRFSNRPRWCPPSTKQKERESGSLGRNITPLKAWRWRWKQCGQRGWTAGCMKTWSLTRQSHGPTPYRSGRCGILIVMLAGFNDHWRN